MTNPRDDKEKEERAIDALITAAFDQDPCEEDLAGLKKYAESLTDEDRAALNRIGANLIDDLFKGKAARASPEHERRPEQAGLRGALHRAEEDAELTDKARQEMEQKMREVDGAGEAKL
jgi:hypothetical protein